MLLMVTVEMATTTTTITRTNNSNTTSNNVRRKEAGFNEEIFASQSTIPRMSMLQKIVNVFHFPSFKVKAILNPIFCFSKYNTKVVNAPKDSKRVSFSFFQSKRNLESNLLLARPTRHQQRKWNLDKAQVTVY